MSFYTSHPLYNTNPISKPGGKLIFDPYRDSARTWPFKTWAQLKACARKGYNITALFAQLRHPDERGYGHFITNLPINSAGIPFSARHTLLAERIRQGYYDIAGCWHPYKNDPRCGGYPKPVQKHLVSFERVKSIQALRGRLLGIEIEYYPSTEQAIPISLHNGPLCRIGTDGSLGAGGQELRKLTWADSQGRLAGLIGLPISGTTDERCGLHVHVDCRHLGRGSLLSIVPTYERVLLFFPHLKRLVPRNRLTNKYCVWENNCNDSTQFLRDSRYCAVNFHAFNEHGTLEFRCQGGMTNPVAIECWALLCQWIVNWAAIRENPIPEKWTDFVRLLKEPLRSWTILRDRAIKSFLRVDARVLSAIHTS